MMTAMTIRFAGISLAPHNSQPTTRQTSAPSTTNQTKTQRTCCTNSRCTDTFSTQFINQKLLRECASAASTLSMIALGERSRRRRTPPTRDNPPHSRKKAAAETRTSPSPISYLERGTVRAATGKATATEIASKKIVSECTDGMD